MGLSRPCSSNIRDATSPSPTRSGAADHSCSYARTGQAALNNGCVEQRCYVEFMHHQKTHLWQLDTTSAANCLLITSAFFEGSSAFSNANLCQSNSWLSSDHAESSILCFPP